MTRPVCVGEQDLQAFLLGQLPRRIAQTVSAHLDVCPECDAQARRFDRQTDPLVRALRMVVRQGGTIATPDPNRTPREIGLPPEYPSRPAEVFGRFRIVRELGHGSFGVVFLADDPLLGRQVALKVPRPETLANPALRERFLREAQAAGRLDHANVAPILEAGEVGTVFYLVSAYCPGPNLAQWLRQQGQPVNPRWAAALVAALADAVQHAHDNGIFHRDIKPANVLLQPTASVQQDAGALEFTPRLTDFGLAKVLEAEIDQTSSGILLGTPPYMAPEQAEGWAEAVGAATDVYALGVILYEVLTGRLSFRGHLLLQTLEQVRAGQPWPLRQVRPDLPRDLEIMCLKCLRRDPGQRYQSAAALAADLRRFLAGAPLQARPPGLANRLWNWCRQPRRLHDAAVIALFLGLLDIGVSSAGIVLLTLGLLSSVQVIPASAFLLGVVAIFGPAQLWIASRTTAHHLRAVWMGLLTPCAQLAYQLGGVGGYIPNGNLMNGNEDQSAFQAQVATLSLLAGVEFVSFILALIAYHANRHVPGFLPESPPGT